MSSLFSLSLAVLDHILWFLVYLKKEEKEWVVIFGEENNEHLIEDMNLE